MRIKLFRKLNDDEKFYFGELGTVETEDDSDYLETTSSPVSFQIIAEFLCEKNKDDYYNGQYVLRETGLQSLRNKLKEKSLSKVKDIMMLVSKLISQVPVVTVFKRFIG